MACVFLTTTGFRHAVGQDRKGNVIIRILKLGKRTEATDFRKVSLHIFVYYIKKLPLGASLLLDCILLQFVYDL